MSDIVFRQVQQSPTVTKTDSFVKHYAVMLLWLTPYQISDIYLNATVQSHVVWKCIAWLNEPLHCLYYRETYQLDFCF